MSKAFIDRNQQQNSNNNQSETTQAKVDPVAQLKWINSQQVDQGWGIPTQMFAQDEEEEPVQGKAEEELMQGKAEDLSAGIQMNEEEEELQMKSGPEGEEKRSDSIGTKTVMPEDVRGKMENSFGTDFSNVNIHQNSDQASNIGALAYTQGNDVHFAPGQYNPGSTKGQELLGHELTHVVQQRQGRVRPDSEQKKGLPAGAQAKEGININSDTALEKEADVMGAKAAQGKMANVAGKGSGVQRKGENAGDYLYYKEGQYPFSDFYWQYLMAEGKGLLGGWSKVKGQANVYNGKNGKTYAKVSAVGFSPSGINGSVEFGGDVEVYSSGNVISKSNFKKYTGASIGDPMWSSVGETIVELPKYGSNMYLRINIGYVYSEGVGAAVPIPAQGHTKLEIPHTVVDAITHG